MQAKVWNRGTNEYSEMFKGKMVVIPAGGFVEMDAHEANTFRGQFTAPIRDTQGRDLNPKPLFVEVIRPLEAEKEETKSFVCQKDGSIWPSEEALNNHIAKNFKDSLDDDGKKALDKSARKGK